MIDFRVLVIDFRVLGIDFWVLMIDFRVPGIDFRVLMIDFRVPAIDFHVLRIDSRVPVSDFWVLVIDYGVLFGNLQLIELIQPRTHVAPAGMGQSICGEGRLDARDLTTIQSGRKFSAGQGNERQPCYATSSGM